MKYFLTNEILCQMTFNSCLISSKATVGLKLEAAISIKKCRLWRSFRIVIYFSFNKLTITIIHYLFSEI